MSGTLGKKNVLLIWLDSLSWREFAAGQARGLLPNLSEFAAQGVVFSQAIAAATTTSPCTASVLTGLFTPNHGVRALRGHRLHSVEVTLPGLLRDAGYKTIAKVSGPLHPVTGLDRGFSEYRWRDPEENLYNDSFRSSVEKVIAGNGQERWFLFLHLWELHAPYWLSGLEAQRRWYDRISPRWRYKQALRKLDQALGSLLAGVGFSSTIVVLMADHGEIVAGPIPRFRHHLNRRLGIRPADPRYVHVGHGSSVCDNQVRVPLIFRADGQLPPSVVPEMVRQVDVAPTIAALCGVEWPAQPDGQSLFDGHGAFRQPPGFAFVEAVGRTQASVKNWIIGGRTSQWKYSVAPLMPGSPSVLHDLQADPGETKDLAGVCPEVARTLQVKIEDLLGAALDDLEWPSPTLGADDMQVLEERLRGLGYL